MKSLFRFIIRYHATLLFVLLELFAFVLVVNYNEKKRTVFLNSSSKFTGYIYEKFNFIGKYFSLIEKNEQLAAENSRYRNRFVNEAEARRFIATPIGDSTFLQHYYYIPARVVNNSTNKQYNYLTLDKGRLDGIKPDMAVVSPNGVVGVVRDVSDNYALVISLLNRKMGVSAKLKKNNYFGSVVWDGIDYRTALLKEIPNHVDVNKGDTIITSGYSIIFPENEPIGIVQSYKAEAGANFYSIRIRLLADFKNLSYVYVIGNKMQAEQKELESEIIDD